MNKDYIDYDVAYLIGLIIGRGKIIDDDNFRVIINFSFQKKLEGEDQFTGFYKSITNNIKPRLKNLLSVNIDIISNPSENNIQLIFDLPKNSLTERNIRSILNNKLNYSNFEIPNAIINNEDENIIKEFLRGFADCSGNVRRSNIDINGFHRVFLDILNNNWKLPVQLCDLLREKLKIQVRNITWGHPNIRGDNIFREHQLRIYTNDFIKIGFYIKHKQDVLETLAKENEILIKNGKKPTYCLGYTQKFSNKKISKLENDDRLPEQLKGKHFNSYVEICLEMGCSLANKNFLNNIINNELDDGF